MFVAKLKKGHYNVVIRHCLYNNSHPIIFATKYTQRGRQIQQNTPKIKRGGPYG